jgi:hypothetical protein
MADMYDDNMLLKLDPLSVEASTAAGGGKSHVGRFDSETKAAGGKVPAVAREEGMEEGYEQECDDLHMTSVDSGYPNAFVFGHRGTARTLGGSRESAKWLPPLAFELNVKSKPNMVGGEGAEPLPVPVPYRYAPTYPKF